MHFTIANCHCYCCWW